MRICCCRNVNMKAFITGNAGFLGCEVSAKFKANRHNVIGYDLSNNQDIHNFELLVQNMNGCDVVIHLAAIENDSPLDTLRTNLIGTYNILNAMVYCKIKKLIFMSSVDALGIFQGEGQPEYLPIDDNYPCNPIRSYSISKKLAEEACKEYSLSKGITVLCIRAPGIWNECTYNFIVEKRRANPEYEWSPYWEYGAFIDIRDLSEVILTASTTNFSGYHCYGISSDDITTSGLSSIDLVNKICPFADWRGGKEYIETPYKSLVNCTNIKQLLDWKPKYRWKDFFDEISV